MSLSAFPLRLATDPVVDFTLEQLAREGARRALQQAIEDEVADYVNPIENTFATVRLRTYRTKGPGSREAGLAMAFKLATKAQGRWRKLNGSEKLQDLIDNIVFVDGLRKARASVERAGP